MSALRRRNAPLSWIRAIVTAQVVVAFGILALLLTGCSTEPPGPSPFQVNCEEELNGKFLEDSATIDVQNVQVSGHISGTVYADGLSTTGTGWGYGQYTGKTTVTARVCIVDGDIKDSEIL
ncbi:hypothetical protein SEA_RASPUTIA_103 [Microbacterium phage Rasputia]|nr:hypothetical protein SEA_RASPUTIA_103 [Microbacterium phage Rasputia]